MGRDLRGQDPAVEEFVLGTLTKWLEDVQASIVRIHKKLDDINGRVRSTEIEVARIKTKMGIVAGGIALVISVALRILLS